MLDKLINLLDNKIEEHRSAAENCLAESQAEAKSFKTTKNDAKLKDALQNVHGMFFHRGAIEALSDLKNILEDVKTRVKEHNNGN